MGLTFSNLKRQSAGSQYLVTGDVTFDSSYPTGGEAYTPETLALFRIDRFIVNPGSGYEFQADYNNLKLKVYNSAGGGTPAGTNGTSAVTGTAAGTNGTSAVTGTAAAQVFTGSALSAHSHNLQLVQDEAVVVTPGTGVAAAVVTIPVGVVQHIYITAGGVTGVANQVPVGSVATSKDVSFNYTTGVMQFLVGDAVTGAKITYTRTATTSNSAGTPAGTNGTSALTATAAAQVFTGSSLTATAAAQIFTGVATAGSAGSEVSNATNLSTLTVQFEAYGI